MRYFLTAVLLIVGFHLPLFGETYCGKIIEKRTAIPGLSEMTYAIETAKAQYELIWAKEGQKRYLKSLLNKVTDKSKYFASVCVTGTVDLGSTVLVFVKDSFKLSAGKILSVDSANSEYEITTEPLSFLFDYVREEVEYFITCGYDCIVGEIEVDQIYIQDVFKKDGKTTGKLYIVGFYYTGNYTGNTWGVDEGYGYCDLYSKIDENGKEDFDTFMDDCELDPNWEL